MQPEISDERRQSIGAFVRRRRKANRMTQQELAELAGVGVRFLKELERDKPTAQMASVNAVLKLFGKELGVVDRLRDPDVEEDPGEPVTVPERNDHVGRALGRDRVRPLWRG